MITYGITNMFSLVNLQILEPVTTIVPKLCSKHVSTTTQNAFNTPTTAKHMHHTEKHIKQ